MKLLIVYTDSHRQLFERFSAPSGFDVVAKKHDQLCSGRYYADRWAEQMAAKLQAVIDFVDHNLGEVLAYSDVDVQFFGEDAPSMLADIVDMAFQMDEKGCRCGGFYAMRASSAVSAMLRGAMLNVARLGGDQAAINYVIRNAPSALKIRELDPKKFWTAGYDTRKVWKPGDPISVPEGIVMHHASWCVGIPNKLRMLDEVRASVCSTRASSCSTGCV
jgi:hypothetical protein